MSLICFVESLEWQQMFVLDFGIDPTTVQRVAALVHSG